MRTQELVINADENVSAEVSINGAKNLYPGTGQFVTVEVRATGWAGLAVQMHMKSDEKHSAYIPAEATNASETLTFSGDGIARYFLPAGWRMTAVVGARTVETGIYVTATDG